MSTLKLLRAKRSLLNARASLFALWSWFLFPPCKVHESARVRALQLSVGLLFPCFCQSLSLSLYLLLSPTSPHSPTPNTYLYKHPYISVSYMSVSSYKKEKKNQNLQRVCKTTHVTSPSRPSVKCRLCILWHPEYRSQAVSRVQQ